MKHTSIRLISIVLSMIGLILLEASCFEEVQLANHYCFLSLYVPVRGQGAVQDLSECSLFYGWRTSLFSSGVLITIALVIIHLILLFLVVKQGIWGWLIFLLGLPFCCYLYMTHLYGDRLSVLAFSPSFSFYFLMSLLIGLPNLSFGIIALKPNRERKLFSR